MSSPDSLAGDLETCPECGNACVVPVSSKDFKMEKRNILIISLLLLLLISVVAGIMARTLFNRPDKNPFAEELSNGSDEYSSTREFLSWPDKDLLAKEKLLRSFTQDLPIPIGDKAILFCLFGGIHTGVPAGIDREAITDANKAIRAGDTIGQQELIDSERVVLIEQHTKVLIIDSTLSAYRVRILTGAHANHAVWVACEAVKSAP